MRSVTYSMGISLDGYIVGPDGGFDWTAPDEEVFRLVTDEIREVGVHLLGRRLYETMLYWETADQDPSLDDSIDARVGRSLEAAPKSGVLHHPVGGARHSPPGLRRPGGGDRAVAGPSRRRATSRSAARRSPPRWPRWVRSTSTGRGSTRCWSAAAFPTSPSTSAGWISNSSRPAPSARASSISATTWRARGLVRRVPASPHQPLARPRSVRRSSRHPGSRCRVRLLARVSGRRQVSRHELR